MTKLLLLSDQREAVLLICETRLFYFLFTTNSNKEMLPNETINKYEIVSMFLFVF